MSATKKVAKKITAIPVSKTGLLEQIYKSLNYKVTISWIKKDQTKRTCSGEIRMNSFDSFGYITLYTDEGIKKVDTRKLISLINRDNKLYVAK